MRSDGQAAGAGTGAAASASRSGRSAAAAPCPAPRRGSAPRCRPGCAPHANQGGRCLPVGVPGSPGSRRAHDIPAAPRAAGRRRPAAEGGGPRWRWGGQRWPQRGDVRLAQVRAAGGSGAARPGPAGAALPCSRQRRGEARAWRRIPTEPGPEGRLPSAEPGRRTGSGGGGEREGGLHHFRTRGGRGGGISGDGSARPSRGGTAGPPALLGGAGPAAHRCGCAGRAAVGARSPGEPLPPRGAVRAPAGRCLWRGRHRGRLSAGPGGASAFAAACAGRRSSVPRQQRPFPPRPALLLLLPAAGRARSTGPVPGSAASSRSLFPQKWCLPRRSEIPRCSRGFQL